jgi:hypothetical protein
MRRYLINSVVVLLIACASLTFAQDKAPRIQWQNALGGSGNDLASSITFVNGGYIVCGTTYSANGDVTSNNGDADIWVVKLDSNGDILWQKTYGQARADIGARVLPTADGGFIVAGTTWPNFVPPTDTNSLQWWIFKIDSIGNVLWEKQFGGSGPDNLTWFDIDPQGFIYCVGHSASKDRDFDVNQGAYDIWVMKLAPFGNLMWKRSFGGSGEDKATQIRVTKDGSCVLVGSTSSTDVDMTENHGGTDGFAALINAAGVIQWKHLYGTPAAEVLNVVDTTVGSGFIVAGITHGQSDPNGDFDVIVLDSAGSIVWEKFYGGSGRDEVRAINVRGNAGYQILGTSESTIDSMPGRRLLKDLLAYRIDSVGDRPPTHFARNFGGNGDELAGGNLLRHDNGGFTTIATTNSKDIYVPDTYGNFDIWVINYGGGGPSIGISEPFIPFGPVDTGTSVTRDVTLTNVVGEVQTIEELYVGGMDSLQFSISPMTLPLLLTIGSDTTVTITYAPKAIGPHNAIARLIPEIGSTANIMLNGEGKATGGSVEKESVRPTLKLIPNPAHEQISITLSDTFNKYFVRIDNAIGEQVASFNVSEQTTQYNIRDLSEGMYIISVFLNDRVVARQKFMKE